MPANPFKVSEENKEQVTTEGVTGGKVKVTSKKSDGNEADNPIGLAGVGESTDTW